MEKIVYTLQSR